MRRSKTPRVDRRIAIKWMLAASASVPLLRSGTQGSLAASPATDIAKGYGTDPNLQKIYSPGDLWPLTLTPSQHRAAAALCDVIIPEDAHSPSASSVGVVDFIDAWVSAPYPRCQEDRQSIVAGLEWLDAESTRRYSVSFEALDGGQRSMICADICYLPKAAPTLVNAARFFARFRDLTAGGFYTTPIGRKDLQYVGNVPLASFDGPPLAVLQALGLACVGEPP